MTLLECHQEGCAPRLETDQPALVRCAHCGAAGPVGRTLEETVSGWNVGMERYNDVIFGPRLV